MQQSIYQPAEVVGIVTSLTFPKNRGDPTLFKILCPNIGKTFDAVCSLYCPIRVSDTIYAFCLIGNDGKLYINKSPFVQPPIDRDGMVRCFIRSLKQGFKEVVKIYNTMSEIAGGDDAVIPFLTGIAQSWNDTHNSEILYMFHGIEPEDIKKILSWWHKERNLRRLYLFGLNKMEINMCRMTCDEIYQKCMDNPYTVPGIPIEKCDAILDRLNKKPDTNDRLRGSIIRLLWKNNNENGWTGTPTRFLTRQFPTIKEHVESLKEDYGMVAELETAYLKFPHIVETWIANYFVCKQKENLVSYDTPIDEKIILGNGDMIERVSAHFTRDLSEEQKFAVQGALDHSISIITGLAGTGKSSVLGEILHNLNLRGIPHVACGFTGKSVGRIREITKSLKPSTIHRLIYSAKQNQFDKRSTKFEKDIPFLEYEHVIIDEASMVTTELLYDFLQVYPNIKKLTLIGDVNQLLPIGWGSLFYHILKSETIPTYKLTTNYRVFISEGERDGIILNANAIISHDPLYPFEYTNTSNFSVMEGPVERVFDIIKGCCSSGIKAEEIVVITPFNKTIGNINRTFQEIYNIGNKFVIDTRGIKWMIGDRVMLIENDNDIGVFNGSQGNIIDILLKSIVVDFGMSGIHEFLIEPTIQVNNYNQPVVSGYQRRGQQMEEVLDGYEGNFSDERTVLSMIHSFAITCDKSQGSEWNYEIFYIPEFSAGCFLNKNRIYTSLTRAKRIIWAVVSDIESFNVASVKLPAYRCENLDRRLKDKLPNLKPYSIQRNNYLTATINGLPNIPNEDIPLHELDYGFDCDDY